LMMFLVPVWGSGASSASILRPHKTLQFVLYLISMSALQRLSSRATTTTIIPIKRTWSVRATGPQRQHDPDLKNRGARNHCRYIFISKNRINPRQALDPAHIIRDFPWAMELHLEVYAHAGMKSVYCFAVTLAAPSTLCTKFAYGHVLRISIPGARVAPPGNIPPLARLPCSRCSLDRLRQLTIEIIHPGAASPPAANPALAIPTRKRVPARGAAR
jgi:hypothetical protein